jgi:hypothetical protein
MLQTTMQRFNKDAALYFMNNPNGVFDQRPLQALLPEICCIAPSSGNSSLRYPTIGLPCFLRAPNALMGTFLKASMCNNCFPQQ